MSENTNLIAEFDKWFNEIELYSLKSERFFDDMKRQNSEVEVMWLKAAFIQGARTMAQDTLNTLGDYSAAMAGVNNICYNSSQAFDVAHKNLMTYFTQILQDTEKYE